MGLLIQGELGSVIAENTRPPTRTWNGFGRPQCHTSRTLGRSHSAVASVLSPANEAYSTHLNPQLGYTLGPCLFGSPLSREFCEPIDSSPAIDAISASSQLCWVRELLVVRRPFKAVSRE